MRDWSVECGVRGPKFRPDDHNNRRESKQSVEYLLRDDNDLVSWKIE